jgi:hypothetical protein
VCWRTISIEFSLTHRIHTNTMCVKGCLVSLVHIDGRFRGSYCFHHQGVFMQQNVLLCDLTILSVRDFIALVCWITTGLCRDVQLTCFRQGNKPVLSITQNNEHINPLDASALEGTWVQTNPAAPFEISSTEYEKPAVCAPYRITRIFQMCFCYFA